MSVLAKAKVHFHGGHKQVSKPDEHKIRSFIKRLVPLFASKELSLLNQPYFMDFKANCRFDCTNANILLAHGIDGITRVFTRFGQNNENTFSMSNIDLLNKIQKSQEMILQGQTLRKHPYEQ